MQLSKVVLPFSPRGWPLRRWPICALLGSMALGCADDAPASGPLQFVGPRPRNLLMLSLDTLRRDHLARFGGDPATAPTLNRFAEEGISLDDHRSCSNWTYGAVVCALSGHDGVDAGFVPDGQAPIPAGLSLLPDWLRGAGLQTALVTNNPYLGSGSGIDARFDQTIQELGLNAEGVVGVGSGLLSGVDERPWYLHLHFIDPHASYDPPDGYLDALSDLEAIDYDLTRDEDFARLETDWAALDASRQALILDHLRIRYDAEVRYMDDAIGALLDALTRRGFLDDTLVVIWSDHGEQFFEHGALTHGRSLHAEEVAGIVLFGGGGLRPAVWSEPTTHADLAPTILDALGLDVAAHWTGASLGRAPATRPLFGARLQSKDSQQSVDADGLRMIYGWKGALQVYDRAADPLEQEDLYDATDPAHRELWALLAPRVEALDVLAGAVSPNLP